MSKAKGPLAQRQATMKTTNTQVLCPCGCSRTYTITAHVKFRPYESLYKQLKTSAARRRHVVDMSFEDFLTFVHIDKCHYCSKPIFFIPYNRGKGKRSSVNLDRKNSDIGYSKDNCVVCCMSCNRGKNKLFTYEEWVVMTTALKEFRAASAHGL
jgi:hypothetical protein